MSNVLSYARLGTPKQKKNLKKKKQIRNLKELQKAMMAKRGGKR